MPYLHFSDAPCCPLGHVDLCNVNQLFLMFRCGVLFLEEFKRGKHHPNLCCYDKRYHWNTHYRSIFSRNVFFSVVFLYQVSLPVSHPFGYSYCFTFGEFFAPGLTGGVSREWQQISSGLSDYSQYSSRSKKNPVFWMASILPPINSCTNTLPHSFGTVSGEPTLNWYYCHTHVPLFFFFFGNVQALSLFSLYFIFYSVVCCNGKIHYNTRSFFFFVARISLSLCILKF